MTKHYQHERAMPWLGAFAAAPSACTAGLLFFGFEHFIESLQSVNVGLDVAEAVSVKSGVLILVIIIAPAAFCGLSCA
jgi:hypothetical protein